MQQLPPILVLFNSFPVNYLHSDKLLYPRSSRFPKANPITANQPKKNPSFHSALSLMSTFTHFSSAPFVNPDHKRSTESARQGLNGRGCCPCSSQSSCGLTKEPHSVPADVHTNAVYAFATWRLAGDMYDMSLPYLKYQKEPAQSAS